MFLEHRLFYFRRNILFLFSIWIIGLFVGICLYNPGFSSLMRSVVFQPVSIVGLLVILFLPLFTVYVSFRLNKPIFGIIVCFLKAIAFGFTGCLVTQTFKSASWLMRLLFLFSDHCFVVLQFGLWFHLFDLYRCNSSKHHHGCCCALTMLVAFCDFFVISPFIKGLF